MTARSSSGPPLTPLLPRIARGDALAVREFISRYDRLVWALAKRFCPEPADAEDAVQDVFLAIWQHAGRFDESRASEPVFITVIARRRLIDGARSRKRRPITETLDEGTAVDEQVYPERSAEAALAVRALETLQPEHRRLLVLSARDGMTQEEIAEHTGLPLGTVKTHIRRALIRVREVLLGVSHETEGQS